MRPASPSFADALRTSHRSTARVSILDPTTFDILVVLSGAAGYVISGSVSMDAGRAIRRTCDVTIANPDGAFTPTGPGSALFFGSLLRLERGVYLDATTVEWFTLGHFVVGRPIADVDSGGDSTLTVQGEDRSKYLVRSRFTAPTTYTTGTRIGAVVQAEAAAAGMGSTRYRLDDSGKTLTKDRTFDEDVSRIDALSDLVRDYGLELFTDADGYLTIGEPPDPITAPLAWTFERGAEAIHTDLSREWTDDRLYNHVLVTGESSDQAVPPVRAEVMDTNPASPTYVGGPLGDRLYRYTSAMITSTAQANEVAVNLLSDVALIVETIDVGAVVNPALEPGDAIAVTDPEAKVGGRYLIDTITVPLGLGSQSIGAKNTRSVGGMLSAMRASRRRWWPRERKAA